MFLLLIVCVLVSNADAYGMGLAGLKQQISETRAQVATLEAQLGETKQKLKEEKEKREADVDQAVSALGAAGVGVASESDLGVSGRAKKVHKVLERVVQDKREAEARADELASQKTRLEDSRRQAMDTMKKKLGGDPESLSTGTYALVAKVDEAEERADGLAAKQKKYGAQLDAILASKGEEAESREEESSSESETDSDRDSLGLSGRIRKVKKRDKKQRQRIAQLEADKKATEESASQLEVGKKAAEARATAAEERATKAETEKTSLLEQSQAQYKTFEKEKKEKDEKIATLTAQLEEARKREEAAQQGCCCVIM